MMFTKFNISTVRYYIRRLLAELLVFHIFHVVLLLRKMNPTVIAIYMVYNNFLEFNFVRCN